MLCSRSTSNISFAGTLSCVAKIKLLMESPKGKSKLFQFALRPFPCSDDFRTGFLKILPVPDRLHKYKRCLIERVGIEKEYFTSLIYRISFSFPIANPSRIPARRRDFEKVCTTRRLSYFSIRGSADSPPKSMYASSTTTITSRLCAMISSISESGMRIPVGAFGFGNTTFTVFPIIVLFSDLEIIIQRFCLIRNPKHICPHIIKRIGDIRKQDRLFAVKKCHKYHGKHIIRTDTGKHLTAPDSIIICDRID